ncbi:MAG: discoidin domain-containing protein [Clostridia bacterium]|nr:discoidin domain-containing protein [Clostridia bacterium]
MTKRIFSILLCTLMLLPLAACGSGNNVTTPADTTTAAPAPSDTTQPTETTTAETTPAETTAPQTPDTSLEARDKSKTYNILMIGNSFSYYNEMNYPKGIFYNVATEAGYKVNITAVYKGGHYLREFLDENDEKGKQVLYLLKNKKYDIVIIQEQSSNPISKPADFYDSVRQFKALADQNGAELWLYATWGYKSGHSQLSQFGKNTTDMEMKLRAAYTAIAEELGIGVAHVGAAFSEIYPASPTPNLYDDDLKHPGPAGSTLAAYTLFGTIFGVDPATVNYNGSLTATDADVLRAAASKIVKNGAPVTDSYKLSSEGVTMPKTSTVLLTSKPSSELISVIYRNDTTVGDGWMTLKSDTSKTFSGIRGDKDKIASSEASATSLTDAQKADIADIGYGVSVIGISHMDSSKKGTVNTSTTAGVTNSTVNLVNGHWGASYMAAIFFDKDTYNINGEKDASSPYTGLITLNFGSVKTFDAIGYTSGSLQGFAQAQDIYVSDDGVNWTKVESASYDSSLTNLASIDTSKTLDPWNNNKPTVEVLFDMGDVSGKYIRIGIIKGGDVDSNTTGLEEINTREIMVYGK